MATTANLLSATDSLVRFPRGTTRDQNPRFLNNDGSPRYSWSIQNGTSEAVSNIVKLPSCNSLLVIPLSTAPVIISLQNVQVPGTIQQDRSPLRYIFHSLILSSTSSTVFSSITSEYSNVTPVTTSLIRDQFTACRSNVISFDQNNQLPGPGYQGGPPLLDVRIQIEGHNGLPLYFTFPALIDADAWKYNGSISQVVPYVPTMYRDVDEVQDPEYPFFKLIDVLSHQIGEVFQTYSNWFRFEPDELPSEALETDEWVRSQLTDPAIAPRDYLPWIANISGRPILRETYATTPGATTKTGWQIQSYPLDMTQRIPVALVIRTPVDINEELVIVEQWDSARTSTSSSINIFTDLIDGATIGGVTVSTGDRVLVRNQLDTTQNGIYDVVASGAATRSGDANDTEKFGNGRAVLITGGSFAGTYWAVDIPDPFTLGIDPISFRQITNVGIFDGQPLFDNALILLVGQNNPAENGVYLITATNLPVRSSLLDEKSEVGNGVYFDVAFGDYGAGTLWRIYNERPVTINEDPLEIYEVDRYVDFMRAQAATAMYGHAASSIGSIENAAKRFLFGDRRVAISTNSPSQYYITVKTIRNETIGVNYAPEWIQCRVATTEPIDLATEVENGSTIDGRPVSTGDRVLIKDQVDLSENGIYTVNSSGAPTRATDLDETEEYIIGKVTYISEGTFNGDTYFTLTKAPDTPPGSTDIVFTRSETLGESDVILQALEPTRPLGYTFIHQTINRFGFTFNSSSLGRFGSGALN